MKFYLSELINKPILNKSGEKIGIVQDVTVTQIESHRPRITGSVLSRTRKGKAFIPAHDFAYVNSTGIKLSTDLVDLSPFVQRPEEVLLANDVYDRQIVDIDDRRLTRVNDLLIEGEDKVYYLKGVDISMPGIFRRLGIAYLSDKLFKPTLVDWEDAQFLASGGVKFNIQFKNLQSLHPVDIGRIIFEGPGYKHGSKVISSLKDPVAADIIEQLSPKLQKNLVESMKLEDVVDVVKHMDPDKIADLLIQLGTEYAQKILSKLDEKEAKIVTSLLNYPENSTGAYMTTDFLFCYREDTLEKGFGRIEELKEMPDFAFYIYVLESELNNTLCGVFSVYEMVPENWRTRVDSIMIKRLIVGYPNEPIKDTLKKMYQYDLSALPIVNPKDRRLLGIVTFRDAISIYLPRRYKTRIRSIFSGTS